MKLDIRSKVLITSAAVIVLAISIISTFSIIKGRNIMLANTMEKELPAVMGELANSINTELQVPIVVSRVMASNQNSKQFLLNGEKDVQAMSHYLAAIKNEFNATSSYYISDATGNYYTANGILTQVVPTNPAFSWFYGFKAGHDPFAVVMNTDDANNKMTLFVNYRVEINGQFKGLTGIGYTVDNVSKLVREYKIGGNGHIFLVDGNGKITVHSDKSKVGKNYFSDMGIDKSSLLNQKKYQSYELDNDQENSIIATSYLKDLGWYIVAKVPQQQVLAPIHQLTYSLIILGIIVAAIFLVFVMVVITRLISPFGKMSQLLEDIGQGGGDLTIRLDESRTDEVGRMAHGYNSFVRNLADILRQVSQTADDLERSISSIDGKTSDMTSDATAQSETSEQVATAVDEMGATAREIATNAQSAAEHSKQAEQLAMRGTESVRQTLETVNKTTAQLFETTTLVTQLSNDTDAIDEVLEVIRAVSEQTNLLALNAAIEAARAGDHGRGFAVVADEVRKLASKSNESAEEIRETIERLKQQTRVVVDSINESVDMSNVSLEQAGQSGSHLNEIVNNMTQVNDMNFQIASATEEQSNVVEEIIPHVASIADVSRQNFASLAEVSNDSQTLKQMASRLNQLVANFKLDK